MGRVQDKVILITGATAGLGRACATALGAEGARIVCTGRSADDGRQTVEMITRAGGEAVYLHQDVTVEAEWPEVIAQAVRAFGRLDGLINNAGARTARPIEVMTVDNFHGQFNLLLESAFLGMRHAMPAMEKTGGGVIVNIASAGAFHGSVNDTLYGPFKAALNMMTRVAALEAARAGKPFRINAICPGLVKVDRFRERNGDEYTDRYIENAAKILPVGFMGEPPDISNAAVFLFSDESAGMNGQLVVADGGRSI